MSDLGRDVKYGIAVEATPGVYTAPTHWFNQLSFEVNPVATYANNESAWGNKVKTNSSTVVRKHVEGSLEAKLTPTLGGMLLAGSMGGVASAPNADASGSVYDHTVTLDGTSDTPTFTLVRQDSVGTEVYVGVKIGEWSMSIDLDGYVTYTADFMGCIGETVAVTAAFSEEAEFVAGDFNVRSAANLAGLAGATNMATVESFSITVNPNLEADNAAGSKVPYGFSTRGYELNFELSCRYTDDSFKNAYMNGTNAAWRMSVANNDVTIGTAAHPGYVFTAPRVNVTDWSREEDLDGPLTQTLTGTVHYSPSDLYALRAVVTNLMNSLV